MTPKGRQVVNIKHRPPLPLREDSSYSLLFEAESTLGPQCNRKD
jgi:hypothetical protein